MTARPRPDVTVVVPFWDLDPSLLVDAVTSMRASGGSPRTIVVDNASTQPLPPLPAWVEVLRLPERVTLGAARNAGLAQVDTPWVMFLDADDEVTDGALDQWCVAAAVRADAIAVRGSVRRRYRDDEPAPARRRGWVLRLEGHRRLLAAANTARMCVNTSTAMLRTDAVRDAGGFGDRSMEEDWVLSAVLAFRGNVVRVEGADTIRRIREDSLLATRATDWSRSVAARRELRRRLRRDPVVPVWVKAATPLLAVLHSRPRWELMRARLSRSR